MSKSLLLVNVLGLALALGGCPDKKKEVKDSPPAAAADAGAPAPGMDPRADPTKDATATPAKDPMAEPGKDPMASAAQSFPIVAAASCAGRGKQLTTAKTAASFKRTGDVVTRKETWAGGCPKGPVFTLAYQPGPKQLEVRLCYDPTKDTCKAQQTAELSWDLGSALKAAGATKLVWVD
jgi:hypothetical protein